APAVILDWSVRYDDEDSRATEYVRIKILREDGRKYGDVELLTIQSFYTVSGIKARTTRPDGTVTPFTGKVYDKIMYKKRFLKVATKNFTLPNVEPGAIIEYRYTTTWPREQARPARWAVQKEIPIRSARFWVRPARTLPSICTTRGLPPSLTPKKVRDHYELEIEKVEPFIEEPLAPPADELKPSLEYFYADGQPDKYWAEVGEAWGKYINQFIGNRSGIRKAAAEITAGATTDDTKLRLLYERAQQVRNLTYEREKSEQEEKREKLRDRNDIEDVLKLGYGSSNDITRLFVGLARAVGFDAWVAAVSARDETLFTKDLPDASQIEYEIAVVKVGETERFYSPGVPYTSPGLVPWANTFVAVMHLKQGTKGTWGTVPETPYQSSVTTRTAELELVDDVLKGKGSVTYRGQDALSRRLDAHTEDEAANRKRFEDEIKTWFPDGSDVKLTSFGPLDKGGVPLVLEFEVTLANLGAATGSRAIFPLSIFTTNAKSPFSAETRKYAIIYPYLHQIEDRVTLRIPEGFAVESLPKGGTADNGVISYQAKWAQKEGAVSLDRKLVVKRLAVGSADYSKMRGFYGLIGSADQESVVLKKGNS
ncbi:MAG TPA: DUF3857 domain-containing protein, partial [Thermoanaerobaculia bacterium]|nr:DUF3857 domain-containing protein [Thermoanaerobaculia bacterium]